VPRPLVAVRELVLIGAGWLCYEGGRYLGRGHRDLAFDHAGLMHRTEAWLHLPSEAALQAAVASPTLFRIADVYYVSVHLPAMAVFLLWGLFRRPWPQYAWARSLLLVQTALGLVGHLAFPLAPPRMFPQWGFLDTMSTYGPSAYGGGNDGVANQFAAMPSLHVGWAVLIAYVVARTGPRWLAALASCWAATTLFVVVITANHWWLDAVVGVLCLVVADLVVRRPRSSGAS
jgi:hypothetical protein